MIQVKVSNSREVVQRGPDGDLVALLIEPFPDPEPPGEILLVVECGCEPSILSLSVIIAIRGSVHRS
jgi:hypothetical protein